LGQVDIVADRDRLASVRRLAAASWIEGCTLLALVFVAVPLKHLYGEPVAVRWLGPVHGVAFLFYVWTTLETASAGRWAGRDIARVLLAAFVPFGTFLNMPFLRRKYAAGPD
jgi:integral membrane protein